MGKTLNKQSLSQVKESIISGNYNSNKYATPQSTSLDEMKKKVLNGDLLREDYTKQIQNSEYNKI